MGSPLCLLLSALLVRSSADDAWQAPVLEEAFDSRLRELADFPASLYPPNLEEQTVAALEDLARLDRTRRRRGRGLSSRSFPTTAS